MPKSDFYFCNVDNKQLIGGVC